MYHYDDFLAEIFVPRGAQRAIITLQDLVPIGRIYITGDPCRVLISANGSDYFEIHEDAHGKTARFLKVNCSGECRVKFFVGQGYWSSRDNEYTDAMRPRSGWAGGDGINSFNLTDGNDGYDANSDNTLFIFGDSFICDVDRCTDERIQPVYMPNNTYALMRHGPQDISFIIDKDKEGKPTAVLAPAAGDAGVEEWFWLQDGVVINDKLFLTPLVMQSDTAKPEGFQFRIARIALVEAHIRKGRPDFAGATQAPTALYARRENKQYVGGIAYMPYHPKMGYADGDGYIYIYGYMSKQDEFQNCCLIVGRVKPEKFSDTDSWRFYDGTGFNAAQIEDSTPLLEHISCEMSVTPIVTGANNGKFLAVFQYNVQSSFVAYSIGETPWGPFGPVQEVYECDENRRIDASVYMYNAKSHSHLSSPDSILVSYNVNSPSMDTNYRISSIYRPRFIRLHDTTSERSFINDSQ